MTTNLPRSSPSAQGVDARGILSFLDALEGLPRVELHSVMLLRHGVVVAEGWWAPYTPDRPHLLYSLSKSFTSTALGFAVAEGLVDLDDTVLSHFPELDAEITDPRARRIRVRHVAAMASGHLADTIDGARQIDPVDVVRGFLSIPPDEEPGSVFAYNQSCTFSLAAIIQKAAGMPLTGYLGPRLFDPLGIGEVGWLTDARGREIGFSGLHATTDAIAKLGQLYLQRGRWGGRHLLDAAWVDDATRAHIANPDEPNPDWRQGYGFQFWMARHGYRGDGAYGQFCVVLPEQDAVLAVTGQSDDMQAVLDAVWQHLLPAMASSAGTAAAADVVTERELARRLASAALPPAPGSAVEGAARTFIASEQNGVPSLTRVTVTPGGRGTLLSLIDAGARLDIDAGIGAWHERDAVVASGGETREGALAFDVVFVETPHRLRIVCGGDGHADAFTATWTTEPLHPLPLAQMRMPRREAVA
jgi:CubicO group peptidase (beta-lactamase class C family)